MSVRSRVDLEDPGIVAQDVIAPELQHRQFRGHLDGPPGISISLARSACISKIVCSANCISFSANEEHLPSSFLKLNA